MSGQLALPFTMPYVYWTIAIRLAQEEGKGHRKLHKCHTNETNIRPLILMANIQIEFSFQRNPSETPNWFFFQNTCSL